MTHPLSLPPCPATSAGSTPAPSFVQLPDGSCVTRRIIDSDNSCLFNAVGEQGRGDLLVGFQGMGGIREGLFNTVVLGVQGIGSVGEGLCNALGGGSRYKGDWGGAH